MRYFMEGMTVNVNKKSNYERYLNNHNHVYPECPVCGKLIFRDGLDKVEYIKTKRQTVIFIHKECVKKWGN